MAVVVNVYGKADLKQIERAEAQLNGLKRSVAGQPSVWQRAGSVITSTGAKIGSALAAWGLARWLKGSTAAAGEAEAVQARLAAAVKAAGGSWQSQGSAIEALITKHSALAAVDDEELGGALAMLVQTTGSVTKSMDNLGLVTDVARGANLDLETSAKLVGKVLSGNTSALSRYGITLKEGSTAQEALALLQGRFAGQAEAYGKTQAGAADRWKVALGNLQETVGGALLPTLTSLAGVGVAVLDAFQRLPGPLQNVAIGVAGVTTATMLLAPYMNNLKPLVTGAAGAYRLLFVAKTQDGIVTKAGLVQYGILRAKMLAQAAASKVVAVAQWLVNAAMSANPLGLIVLAIAGLVAAFVVLWKKSDAFRNFWIGLWEHVKASFSAVWPVIKAVGAAIVSAISWVWEKVSAGVRAFWDWAGPFIKTAVGVWWQGIKLNVSLIVAVVRTAWDVISAAIKWFWGWAGPFIKTEVAGWLAVIKTTFSVISTVVQAAWSAIQTIVRVAVAAVSANIRAISAVIEFVRDVWEKIRAGASAAWNAIKSVVSSAAGAVKSAITGPISAAASIVSGAWASMKGAASAGVSGMLDVARAIGGKIKSAVGNLGSLLYGAGQDVVRGLLNGITSAWHWITDKLHSLISGLSSAAKKVLGISSPSRVFAAIGKQAGAGLALGIDASARAVAAAAAGMAQGAAGGAEMAFAGAGRSGGRSVVIMPGAVQVTVQGAGAGGAAEITPAVRAGVEPALAELAREINAL